MTARLTVLVALLALVVVAVPTPAAGATPDNVKSVIRDYKDDGKLDPCAHSVEDLRDTLKALTADTQQYAPDFPAAVQAAIEAQARGDCDKKAKGAGGGAAPSPSPSATPSPAATTPAAPTPAPGGAAPAPSPPPGASPEVVPEPPAPPATAQAPAPGATAVDTAAVQRDGFPTVPLIVLGALLAAALLAGLLLFAAERLGWGEDRLAGARHALAEAGYRTGGTWQDFTDWLRLGR